MNEQEKENRAELFRLMMENPELPVLPMVDSEIVADDGYNRWVGAWGSAYIGEYVDGKEHLCFRDDDDIEIAVIEIYGRDAFDEMDYEEMWKAYRSLPWIKAIIVNIDLPN